MYRMQCRVASLQTLARSAAPQTPSSLGFLPLSLRPIISLALLRSGSQGTVLTSHGAVHTSLRFQSSSSTSTPAGGVKPLTTDDIDDLLNQLGDDGSAQEVMMDGGAEPVTHRFSGARATKAVGESAPANKAKKTANRKLKKKKKPPASARENTQSDTLVRASSRLISTEPETTIAAARNRAVAGDRVHQRDESCGPSASGSLTQSPAGTMGWSYESIDPQTGKTQLEVLYESNLERIQRILERPLPPLPQDGHVNPDFFVGFGHYDYRLRDEYRAILARELRLPVKRVKLSVAWGGRFDVSRFNRVRKVCGVCIERQCTPLDQGKAAAEKQTLPEELQQRIASLVQEINGRRTERLLQSQLLQASEAIPEVDFAYTHREYRLLVRLHEWLHAHLLKQSLAVIVVGGNQVFREWRQSMDAERDGGKGSRLREEGKRDAKTDPEWIRKSLTRSAQETRRQASFVDEKWLKPFHNRHLIPRRISLGEAAALLARAVLDGGVSQVEASDVATRTEEQSGKGAENLLPTSLQQLLQSCAPHLSSGNNNSSFCANGDRKEQATQQQRQHATECIFDSDQYWSGQPPDMQAAALQWLHITREALFLDAQPPPPQRLIDDMYATCSSSSGEGPSVATPGGGDEVDGGVYRRLTQFTGDMPALFVHGAYAGGLKEMRYLQSNKAAMDALLLHPNDITMRRSFASRMRNGHQRLRMHEELAASDHHE